MKIIPEKNISGHHGTNAEIILALHRVMCDGYITDGDTRRRGIDVINALANEMIRAVEAIAEPEQKAYVVRISQRQTDDIEVMATNPEEAKEKALTLAEDAGSETEVEFVKEV